MTMVLVIVTPAAIYLAADSRQYPSGLDTVQKVFLVGKDAAIAHLGIGRIPRAGSPWDATEEMTRISSSTPDDGFDAQLAYITEASQSSFSTAVATYSDVPPANPRFVF